MCGMGARKRGGSVMGRGEEGMEVLACVCVRVSRFVCVYVYVSSEGSGQGDELEMQEVYRWAKDRAAKKGHISNIRGLVFRY